MQLSTLTEPVVIAAALFASAFVFILWVVGSRTKSSTGTVLLDIVSMLIGVAGLGIAVFDALYSHAPAVFLGILGFAGVVLIGKSLRDLPWVGLVSVAAAVAAGFVLNGFLPVGTPIWVVVGVAAFVLILAYLLLGAVGGLFKIVALLAIPRIVSILTALAAVAAGIFELFPNVAAGAP